LEVPTGRPREHLVDDETKERSGRGRIVGNDAKKIRRAENLKSAIP
jgi:hypothetical protein